MNISTRNELIQSLRTRLTTTQHLPHVYHQTLDAWINVDPKHTIVFSDTLTRIDAFLTLFENDTLPAVADDAFEKLHNELKERATIYLYLKGECYPALAHRNIAA